MKIINQSKNTVLAQDIIVTDNFLSRAKGLLGRKEFLAGQALIIKPAKSIHTFFMHFPIDVLFVNKNKKIIKAITALAPYRFTAFYFNAVLVIELPAYTLQKTSTQEGDLLSFDFAF